jgi:hypothetical protein
MFAVSGQTGADFAAAPESTLKEASISGARKRRKLFSPRILDDSKLKK